MFDPEQGVGGVLWPYVYLADLKPATARAELQRLREKGFSDFETLIRPSLEEAAIKSDFNTASLVPVCKHVCSLVSLVPAPDWYWKKTGINRAALAPGSDLWFSEDSRPRVFATSFYFGETMFRNYPFLRWDPAPAKQGTKNLPCIMGFKWAYLEPLVITSVVLFRSIYEEKHDRLEMAMKSWIDQADQIQQENTVLRGHDTNCINNSLVYRASSCPQSGDSYRFLPLRFRKRKRSPVCE